MQPAICTVCGCRVFVTHDNPTLFTCLSCQTIFQIVDLRQEATVQIDGPIPLYILPTDEDAARFATTPSDKAVSL